MLYSFVDVRSLMKENSEMDRPLFVKREKKERQKVEPPFRE
jgi:hypothetical protein